MIEEDQREPVAAVLAFLGNSLLAPVNQTGPAGLDPKFWDACPDFGSAEVRAALDACARNLEARRDVEGGALETSAAVEFARLFVGPPRPAAAPWETAYRTGGKVVGFGEATFEMRRMLRGAGLDLAEGRNQYEDHFGLELLLLSELVARAARNEGDMKAAEAFAARPLGWVAPFREKVALAAPGGYYAHLLAIAETLLHCFETNDIACCGYV